MATKSTGKGQAQKGPSKQRKQPQGQQGKAVQDKSKQQGKTNPNKSLFIRGFTPPRRTSRFARCSPTLPLQGRVKEARRSFVL